MGYIGNQITSVPFTFDRLSGDSSRRTFIMSRAPAAPASVMVFISGVYKVPEVDYTVSGTDITFTVAPASGTDNIVVHHIGNGSAATQIPVTGSVTTDKIGTQAVRGNQIGLGAVSGNNIAGINSINASNSLTALSITGNLIGTGAVSGNNIVGTNSINASNSITALSITGNLIGTGAISANHYAGGGVTSEVLSSNLQISVARVAETINVYSTPLSGNFNIHTTESTVYYFTSNTTSNSTFNLVANTGSNFAVNSLDAMVKIGQSVSVTCFVKQGSTRFRSNVFIDGVRANSIFWVGNSQPLYQTSQPQSLDIYSISAVKMGANTWTVVASATSAGHANGQGMGATNGTVY